MKVKVIGCGLIGTSIALRLKERGHEIWLADADSAHLKLALELVGNAGESPNRFDLIVLATPVNQIVEVLRDLDRFDENSTVIDVGGLKSKLIVEVDKLTDLAKIFVSTHPMAGREVSGPSSAQADLFEGRAFIMVKTEKTLTNACRVAESLGKELGSICYWLTPQEHDATISTVSHLPQILSSLMGKIVNEESAEVLNFAGQGLRDISRLAGSDPGLWEDLLQGNSEANAIGIQRAIVALQKLQDDLSTNNREGIKEFLQTGKTGRAKIPGKHGAKARKYSYLPIVIDDKPGQLAKIFDECALCEVNVEDLDIEHSPNQATGLITLALSANDAEKLQAHLRNKGWRAQEIH
jgi:prephenate dehydrogenase